MGKYLNLSLLIGLILGMFLLPRVVAAVKR
jgi:uncharacterized protein YneF (UPF0154 family)